MGDAPAARLAEYLYLYRPRLLPSGGDHARHDHGGIPADRVVSRGVW